MIGIKRKSWSGQVAMAGFWPNARQTNSTGRREERGAAMTLFPCLLLLFLPVLRTLLVYYTMSIDAYLPPDRSHVLTCPC